MKKQVFVNLLTILTLSLTFFSCGNDKNESSQSQNLDESSSSDREEITTSSEEEPITSSVKEEPPSSIDEMIEANNNYFLDNLQTMAVVNQQHLDEVRKLKMEYSEYEIIYTANQEEKNGGEMKGYFDLDNVIGELDLTMLGKKSHCSISYQGGAYYIEANGKTDTLNVTIEEARALFMDDIIYKACIYAPFFGLGTGLSDFYDRYDLLFNQLDQVYTIPDVDNLRSLSLKYDEVGHSLLTMNSNIVDFDVSSPEGPQYFSLVCNERVEMNDYLFTNIEIINDMSNKNANKEVTEGKRIEIHSHASTTL